MGRGGHATPGGPVSSSLDSLAGSSQHGTHTRHGERREGNINKENTTKSIGIYIPLPYLHSYPRGVERVHPRCLPLECMTGMTPPLSPGLSPLLTRPVCTGTNLARTLHTYNVVVSILGEDQKGSQGGWLVRLNRSH